MPDTMQTTSALSLGDRWDHALARMAWRRMAHRVEPGLYAVGRPGRASPVLVTANYTLSFDAVRSSLSGQDAYVLVLDTGAINVWCAAGKGTFGTDELVRRVEAVRLHEAVDHRRLVLPQLSAPGVCAREVRRRTGFDAEFGPVRARDIPEYLRTGTATPEMRRVDFPLRDRAVLVPVEVVGVLLPFMLLALVGWLFGLSILGLPFLAGLAAGVVLFPLLLPYLPTPNFVTKGAVLGLLVQVPFAALYLARHPDQAMWYNLAHSATYFIGMAPITAFVSLNFTGSTTFTSRTGVRAEIDRYMPTVFWTAVAGLVLNIAFNILRGMVV